MIPIATDDVKVESNISADASGEFSVDQASMAKIMAVLTNLYTDPEGAVVREYLTNAYDSQIEAKNTIAGYVWRPIEVNLPSRFNRNYTIRDFGVGMDKNDLIEIYSKYGKSTKESSNDYTGMLGLGSKCALTYTNQFTVIGYKNGTKTTAIISRNEANVPVFQILDSRPSDEPSGVEIAVPVKDSNSFSQKTYDFLRWWDNGMVLVDGREPVKHGMKKTLTEQIEFTIAGTKAVHDVDIYVNESERTYNYQPIPTYVVMGNVPYLVSREYLPADVRESGISFTAYVPTGSVAFPPSREELTYTVSTRETINKISSRIISTLAKQHHDAIDNAKTKAEAIKAWSAVPHFLTNHFANKTYNGHKIVSFVAIPHGSVTFTYDKSYIYNAGRINTYAFNSGTSIIVTGYDSDSKYSAYVKRKIRHFAEQKNVHLDRVILLENDTDNFWLSDAIRVSMDDIKKIKLPSGSAPAPKRDKVPYDFYMLDANNTAKHERANDFNVPKGKKLVYISPADMAETFNKRGTNFSNICFILGSDYIVVSMPKNRTDKFLRSYKDAVHAKVAFQEVLDKAHAKVTPDEVYANTSLTYSAKQFFLSCNVKSVQDPELVAIAKIVQGVGDTSNIKKVNDIIEIARRASIYLPHPGFPEAKGDNPATKYPLIEACGRSNINEVIFYCNAKYAASNP